VNDDIVFYHRIIIYKNNLIPQSKYRKSAISMNTCLILKHPTELKYTNQQFNTKHYDIEEPVPSQESQRSCICV
jgi:hypothetical protein